MQSTRSALVFGLIILALAGVVAPDIQAATVNSFTSVPGTGGDVTLSFMVTGSNPMTVDVFRLVSTTQPIPSQFIAGTLVADNVPVSSGVPKIMVNTSQELTNMANGFLAGKVTVSGGLYWYMFRVTEPGPLFTDSSIQGAVADADPPATLADGALTIECANASPDVEVTFANPFDNVVDASATMALNPGSVKQHAQPAENYSFDFLLYRVAQSESFDVVNDPVPGNVIDTVEIDPYNRGALTSYVDSPAAAGAYAYAVRIQDTVGNLNGGSPLTQTQAVNIVTPPTDVAVSETLVAGLPTCIVTFTVNTQSLVSDPGDVSPGVIRIYARDDGAAITGANIYAAGTYLIGQQTITSGLPSEVITFNHDPNNAVLPRISPKTYTYAALLVTDNDRVSCVSNSPSITTTDLLPPGLITLVSPADGLTCVRGTQLFAATVADDAGGSGIQSVTFTLEDATGTVNILGADLNVTLGGASGSATLSVDTTAVADGTYIYSATAFDFAGNSLETGSGDPGAGPDFTISINNSPGSAAIVSPASGVAVNSVFVVSGTAEAFSDITAVTLTYSTFGADAAVVATGTETWTASIPVDASMADSDILTVTVEVHDACGLINNSVTREFCVDNLCVLAKWSLDPGPIFGPSGLVVHAGLVDDGYHTACNAGVVEANLFVTTSGYSFTTGPSPAPEYGVFVFDVTSTFGLLDGQSADIILSGTDGAIDVPNSCQIDVKSITADFTAPACTITSPIAGSCDDSFVISGTAQDFGAAGIGDVAILISGPVASASHIGAVTSFSDVFAPGVDGTYSIIVAVTDTVGNTSTCGPVTVTIDVAAPLVAILSPMPVANVGVNGAFIVSGTADDMGCSGVMDMTVEYTTSSGTTQAPVTFSPVGGLNTTWSVVIPVDALLADDAAFIVTVYAVDGIPMLGSTSATYFVDNTDSCPTLVTPLVSSTVFLGPNGLDVAYTVADDDTTFYDTGVSMVYASVSSPSVSPATATLFSSAPPALGTTSATDTLIAGSGPGAVDEFAFGLTDGDIADINVCLVDGATGTANVCCVQFQVNVDLTPPTCEIVSPSGDACLDYSNLVLGATDVLVEATDDNSGLSEVGITILSGSLPVYSDSTPASGLMAISSVSVPFGSFTPGTYTVVTTVTDVAGNVTIDCSSITVDVNTSIPLAAITTPAEAVANVSLIVSGTTASSATSATLYYPGAGGGLLPALDPSIEAAVAPVPVFSPTSANQFSLVSVSFVNGFVFPFYGGTYSEVMVSARGVLGFGNHLLGWINLTDSTPSATDVNFQVPKVMPLWSDLDASGNQGGSTTYRQYDDRFIIDYRGIPDSSGTGNNDFSVVLFNTGAVQFIYGQTMTINPATTPVAVGISAGVFAQDVSGYDDVFLASNGVQRLATTLTAVPGYPALSQVSDNALYEIFSAGTFGLHVSGSTTTYNVQGTSLSTPLALSLSGNWSTNFVLPINGFYGDGDILAMSVRATGGCNDTTQGPGSNIFYTIDETIPAATVTNVSIAPYTCVNQDFQVVGQLNDSGTPGYRIDSGISDATYEFYQNGILVAVVPVGAAETIPSIPTRPNVGQITATITVDPAALGIAPGLFGIDLVATDSAINIPNTGSAYGGTPPEVFIYDPVLPKSQVVCSRLFIAAITEVAGVSQTTIFELDPITGAELASIPLPATMASPLGSALGYNGVNLYYAPTLGIGSPATIYAFTAITSPSTVTGPSAVAAAYVLPSTITHITGIGADDDTVYVNGPSGATFVYKFTAAGLVLDGTQSIGTSPGTDTDSVDVGSGIFDRTFIARPLFQPTSSPISVYFESYPDSTPPGGFQNIYTDGFGDQAVGVGFSGTRLYVASGNSNVVRELVTTSAHASYRSGVLGDLTPTEINTLPVPSGYTVQTVAAGARVTSCTLCGPSLPYTLTSAATDTSPCGIGEVSFYGFETIQGITGEVLFGTASSLPDLVNRATAQFDESSAAVASAVLTQASVDQILPAGEGVVTLYSIATDQAGNAEMIADALTRAVTLTIDTRAPRINYLAAVPFAATSGADTTIELTMRIEEMGSGLDPANPPVLVANFGVFAASGVSDVTLPLTLAASVHGVITATASFVPSALGLPLDGGAYIDFTAIARDICGNTASVVLAARYIVDNQSPLAGVPDPVPDPYYPAEAIIANGTTGNSLWSMTNSLTWTANELRDPASWDLGFILNTTNPGLNAQRPEYLAGTYEFPVSPEILSQDFKGLLPEVDLQASPSGIASVELYYATGTSSATPPLVAFSNLIQTITEVVAVPGGGYIPLATATAASAATGTFVWDTSHLKTTATGSDDYYYLKTITRDHAGNLLDPIFGPFVILDVLSPTRTIITAEALFGTNDVRIDWEYVPYDNVGVVGYELYRTRDAVDDVLDADPLTDFSLLAIFDAYDRPLGDPARQAITEYIDTSVPSEGSYAYYLVAYDAAGNGKTGGLGLAPVISNIVVAAPYDLVDPYPVTDLKVRAGEPANGNLLAWSIPDQPLGGGTVYPLGDNVAISGWEIYRHDLGEVLLQTDVSDLDGDQLTSPIDQNVHLLGRIDNTLVMDNVSDTSRVRLNPSIISAEKATISAASPDQIYLFMEPIDVERISRVWNKTTGESYSVVGFSGAVVQIEGTNLPETDDEVLVDYETDARTFVDTAVIPGVTYSYAIVARDAAGNRSLISTSVEAGDATVIAFDTTPPKAITALNAIASGCDGMRVYWFEAPYDETAIMGYDAYRHIGVWDIENVDNPDETQVRQALYPVIHLAPSSATVTITLEAADVPDELFVVIDSTRNRLIPSVTDVIDVLNNTYYVVAGDQLEVRNIKSTAGFLHNLKVVYFNPDLSLFSGTGYDGQTSFLDDTTVSNNLYTYAVQAVDPWGNVAAVSNQATEFNNDCIPPQLPLATVQSNCSYEPDVVAVTVMDDDVAMVCAYDNVLLTGPSIVCVEDPDGNGVYSLPIGDNQYEHVWVSAIDFSGNTSPSVEVVNDVTPPTMPSAGGVQLIQNAPGSNDLLTVISLDPDAYRVNVYRDGSLFNLVDSALDGDDGTVDGQWTLNVGDNISQTFFVTIADEACNESDDLEVSNDTTSPNEPTNVVVQNNITGTMCDRIPVEDTLTACVGSGVVMLEVFADASLLIPVTSASVSAGPSGSCVGPIGIGNNNSFTPGSLDGVYVVATDNAGNKSAAVYAAVDITAPEIASLDLFEQFPQVAGTFPRVEDELDVQIDIDTADQDEVLCVKVFTESPTLNRESPMFLMYSGATTEDIAPTANNDVLAVGGFGTEGAVDDILVAIHPDTTMTLLNASLLDPTALAVKSEGTGNVWVGSVNPSATSEIRLTEFTQAGVLVQTIDLALAPPVTGMTFGSGDTLYFVTRNGGSIYTFDTVALTQNALTISSGTIGEVSSIAFDGIDRLYFLDLMNSSYPTSGVLQSVDVAGGAIETMLYGLVQPAGIAIDRRGGIHYGESSGLYAGLIINPQGRVSELRPGASGPLTLFEGGDYEPSGDTLVGPIIAADGRMITVGRNYQLVAIYTSNRRGVDVPDTGLGQAVPEYARILAEQVPGPDYRVEGIKVGDNAAHEIQAVVVDKAGNTSSVATALNDVVGPVIGDVDVVERNPGFEDSIVGWTDPYSVVRAYTDPYLNNEIDREDNAVYSDRTGDFNYGEIGDNQYAAVFVAAEDEAGNVGQARFAFNDIFEPYAPDLGLIEVVSACPGSDDLIIGADYSVEPNSWVEVYADYELTQYVGGVVADSTGAFGPISIGDDQVTYAMVLSIDDAGNVSEAVMLDGDNGHSINDLSAPEMVELSNVTLTQALTGEDFVTGLPGAVIPGDASLVRIFTDEDLTTELVALSPIIVDSATGGWSTASVGTNMMVGNTLLGYASLWLVAEDDACNQALPVRIDLDRAVYEPNAGRFVFNAVDPNNNTIAGIEGAAGEVDQLMFSTSVSDPTNSVLGLPLLGYAISDTAGAFQAINVGRVGVAVSYVVAMDEYGNLSPVVEIDTADTVAPVVPDVSRIILTERGKSFNDTLAGLRGAVGTGEEDLLLNAYTDGTLTTPVSGFPIAILASAAAPGSFDVTSIGENYADNTVNPVGITGMSRVWLTAEDEFGNESEASYIDLDVTIQNPDSSKIFVYSENPQTDAYVSALNNAVEGGSRIQVSADKNNILLYGNFYANSDGGWDAVDVGSLLRQPDVVSGSYNFPNRRDVVYVRAIDTAGNRSAVIAINVEIVTYAVLDAFGDITFRNGVDGVADSLQADVLTDAVARDITPGFYHSNGALTSGFSVGDGTLPEFTNSPSGFYRLTGYGEVVALGDILPVDQTGFTPFTTDVAKDMEVAPIQEGTNVGMYVLDGFGGLTVFGGATGLTGITFGFDFARDLELDYDVEGLVKGAYILDGSGGMNPVGASALLTPSNPTSSGQDIYIDAELVRTPGSFEVEGALVLSKYGKVTVGGPLALDAIRINSLTKGLPNFGFNIARDLELSVDPENRNVNGTYVLDGFGGVHTGGSAPKVHDAPYYGIDVARDLEISTYVPQE